LLSTTDNRSRERGQVLVLFVGGLFTLFVIAALAFDVGMMLVERRDQQNAADAAALAGARYVLTDEVQAEAAARQIAITNGFDDADSSEVVSVYIPPIHGIYVGLPGFIEVQIEGIRPSVFGGIIGRAQWPVGAYAVATNSQNLTFPFSMLALDPTACKAIGVQGTGVVEAYANIQSNSSGADCDGIGFSRTGGSTIDVIADDATCRSVGEIQDEGSGDMTCLAAGNSFALPDPLRNLPAPVKPALPTQAMVPVGHTNPIPDNCPGATPASKAPSETTPKLCKIPSGGTPANIAWILYPGLYPGGLEIDKGRIVYLMPGIYWIGGGGLIVKGDASIVTIATETDANADVALATWGGGVLLYNSTLPVAGGEAGEFHLNGSGATMKLKAFNVAAGDPLDIYNDIVIFQDRTVDTPVTLNGSASGTEVAGVIYVPEGQIKLNGNGGTLTTDQIIAGTYDINGNGGTIQVLHGVGFDSVIVAAGLVE
jgi:hypothetical protein